VDSALEVSVTRKDCGSNNIAIDDSILNFLGNLTGVSDTGHTTITSGGETELI
jgi:hypothetical protein